MTVTADQQEYRPAAKATVRLDVKDHRRPRRGQRGHALGGRLRRAVADQLPHARRAGSVYVAKSLQVINADNRQRIVVAPRADAEGRDRGGGGGDDGGAGTLRKDFRVLAFWLGSVTTGADGRASVDVTLPESLTTYRIMAVAAIAARASDPARPKSASTSRSRSSRPSRASWPSATRAYFGAVVGSQLPAGGHGDRHDALARSRACSSSPAAPSSRSTVGAGGIVEVRFARRGARRSAARASR